MTKKVACLLLAVALTAAASPLGNLVPDGGDGAIEGPDEVAMLGAIIPEGSAFQVAILGSIIPEGSALV